MLLKIILSRTASILAADCPVEWSIVNKVPPPLTV